MTTESEKPKKSEEVLRREIDEINARLDEKLKEIYKQSEQGYEKSHSTKPCLNFKRYFQNNVFWRLYLVSFSTSVYFAFDTSSGVLGQNNILLDLLFSLMIALIWIPGVALILGLVGALADWVFGNE